MPHAQWRGRHYHRTQTGPPGCEAPLSPPAALGKGQGAVPHGPFPPSPPPNRAGGFHRTRLSRSQPSFKQLAGLPVSLRVPFTACPSLQTLPLFTQFWTPASSGRERLPTIPSARCGSPASPFSPVPAAEGGRGLLRRGWAAAGVGWPLRQGRTGDHFPVGCTPLQVA